MTVNDNDSKNGQLGVLIDSDLPLSTGVDSVIKVHFDAVAPGEAELGFSKNVARTSASNAAGDPIPVRFVNGKVIIARKQD